MQSKEDYQRILEEYPEEINKEQFYKLAHISKRTAQFLLESGTVPCKSTGKKTRKYTIRTRDALCFIKNREQVMDILSLPTGWYARGSKYGKPSQKIMDRMRLVYENAATDYPDVLNVKEVCEITGYGETTVSRWCKQRLVQRFFIHQRYRIPKESLIEFMMSARFRRISVKSDKHKDYIEQMQDL